ncbi:MAG: tyrosine-type recombinase/integrase, partial [Verrucomicrobiota bacterium]
LASFVRMRRRAVPTFSRGWMTSVVKILVELGAIKAFKPLPKTPPTQVERTLELFGAHLQNERALKSSLGTYMRIVSRFLVYRFGSQKPRPEAISADDLTKFVLRDSRRYSIGTTKLTVTALRCYVRYLHVSGVIQRDLTGAIPAIAGWRLTGIPKGIEPQELSRLLQSPNRQTRGGRSDYAILLLLSRLGLRRNEVASLALEDINWERGELLIRGKGEKQERLPLPKDVGTALAAHLKKGVRRNQHSRAVFFSGRMPFSPLSSESIGLVVTKAAVRAGLPHVGAHRLRHTLATQTLRQGGSLDEIAQVLRHSSHDTTAIYAKVDLTALIAVTQIWPGGVS